jgi:hypothetical protein
MRVVKVKAFSDEYFALLRAKPALSRFFALGNRVRVKLAEDWYEVVD